MNMEYHPFYMDYPAAPLYYYNGYEQERDMERLKDFYPDIAKEVQRIVEDECDQLEYDGSFMFDEYPDRLLLRTIVGRIYDRAKYLEPDIPTPQAAVEGEAFEVNQMNYDRRPRRNSWLEDLISIMLINEMYNRRCRRRNCRRWY